jgi:osmotically-inducible protein OsmY
MILKTEMKTAALAAGLVLGAASVALQAQDLSESQQVTQNTSGDMAARVKIALHSDPALYDKHIDVSMEKGKVVMRGFVMSAGDMEKAIKAASKTVGPKNFVNKITIKKSDDINSDNSNG